MQINFTGHQVAITDALRDLTEKKFERITRRMDNITSINVTFAVEKLAQIAEATIRVPKSEIHARAESDDLYTAIDDLTDKLIRQVDKHKDKLRGE